MMDAFGDRQQELLRLLFKRKQGLTLDAIAEELGITRTAVRQHITAFERLGYVERGDLLDTGGRPVQTYRLTDKGQDLFPKQYSWFSEVLLGAIAAERGSQELGALMTRLGDAIAAEVEKRVKDKSPEERVRETVKVMNELAYEAEAVKGPGKLPAIQATNCVYHALARKFPEVCRFDLALLERLTGAAVTHEECILRGGGHCRFSFKPKP